MARKSAGRWFRMYETILENPKVDRLPGDIYKGWVKLCALASRYGGDLPAVPDIAFGLRMSEPQTQKLLEQLTNSGLVDNDGAVLTMHDWNEHQYQSDVSTDRVKAFRERRKPVSETVAETPMKRFETVAETPPDTDTDTDTEAETEQKSSLRSDTPQAADLALDEPEPPASKPLRKPKPKPKFPEWFPLAEWQAFAEMRKKIRAPLTDGAIALNVKTLLKLRAEGHDPAAVLNQSTANAWRGLFSIKPEQGHGSKPHGKNGSTAADRAIRVLAEMSGFEPRRTDEPGCDPNAADDDTPRLALVACGTAQEARAGSDIGADQRPARQADPALLDARSHRSADEIEIPGFLLRS